LVALGASPHVVPRKTKSTFGYALELGNPTVIDQLFGLDKSFSDNFQKNITLSLHLAFLEEDPWGEKNVNKELMRESLRRGVPVNSQDAQLNTPLHHAVRFIRVPTAVAEEIKFLVEKYGASVSIENSEGLSPIELAVQAGNIELAQYLLKFKK
jgi:ankyrin repeat protein